VNNVEAELPSALVARTVTVQDAALSKFRLVLLVTVTIPDEDPTANTPEQDCALTLYVIVLVEPSESLEDAVTPTVVPAAEFSSTVLVAELESVGVEASNSS
jgi:hypothetical protein